MMPPLAAAGTREPQSRLIPEHLTKAAAVASLAGLLIALYHEILYDLLLVCWNTEAASQGLIIPPLALYIAYVRRGLVRAEPARIENSGILLVALSAMLLVIGKLGAEFFLSRISFVCILAGLLWTFQGRARLRVLLLPLLLLASMIPLPLLVYNSLSGPLRLFASATAELVAEWAGVTLYRQGNTIHLATLAIGVEDACSGLTSLSSTLVAALLLAYTFTRRFRDRILIVSMAIPIAVLANVLRVAGTAILSDHNPVYALGFYHAFSGWVVFVAALSALYGVAHSVRFLAK